jgi:BolA family transcriptional regulator, general stress-responsive regulator
MSVQVSDIESTLRASLEAVDLAVIDDSHLHAGHAGAQEGRHFTVRISSHRFAGLTKVAQHRLVYDALRFLMPKGIHALALETRLPGATLHTGG